MAKGNTTFNTGVTLHPTGQTLKASTTGNITIRNPPTVTIDDDLYFHEYNRTKLDNIFVPSKYDESGYYKALYDRSKSDENLKKANVHNAKLVGLYTLERLANGRK